MRTINVVSSSTRIIIKINAIESINICTIILVEFINSLKKTFMIIEIIVINTQKTLRFIIINIMIALKRRIKIVANALKIKNTNEIVDSLTNVFLKILDRSTKKFFTFSRIELNSKNDVFI